MREDRRDSNRKRRRKEIEKVRRRGKTRERERDDGIYTYLTSPSMRKIVTEISVL